MQRVTLTDLLIRNLKPAPTGQRYVVHDALLPEFGVLVTDKGSKSFTVYKRWPGEKAPKRLKIGDANKMKLTDARKLARRRLEMAAEGVNYRKEERKAAEERAKLAAHTFSAVATAWFAFIQKQDRRGGRYTARIFPVVDGQAYCRDHPGGNRRGDYGQGQRIGQGPPQARDGAQPAYSPKAPVPLGV
jgi:hypothetical protein